MTSEGNCKSQESKLTLIYTLGVFSVNFGQALVGPFLDALGPRLVRTWNLTRGLLLRTRAPNP